MMMIGRLFLTWSSLDSVRGNKCAQNKRNEFVVGFEKVAIFIVSIISIFLDTRLEPTHVSYNLCHFFRLVQFRSLLGPIFYDPKLTRLCASSKLCKFIYFLPIHC